VGFPFYENRTDARGKNPLGDPATASSQQPSSQGKISPMARGWESKSVEQQQEEMSQRRETARSPISSAEQQRNRKRDGLLLSRQRLTQSLQTACNPRHRQMLEQSIAELDRQLSSLERLTDPTSAK